jgi:hypothetical protein
MFGRVGKEFVQSFVIDFHFQFFVEAVGYLPPYALFKCTKSSGTG